MTDLGINWSYKQKKLGYPWLHAITAAEPLSSGQSYDDAEPVAVDIARRRSQHLLAPLQVLAAQTDYSVTDYRVTEALRHRGPPSPQLRRPRQSTPASRTSWLPSPPTPSPSRVHYLNEVTI